MTRSHSHRLASTAGGIDKGHIIEGVAQEASHSVATDTDGSLLSKTYRLLTDMSPVISSYQGTGQMAGVLQVADEPITMPLEKYILTVTFNHPIFEPLPESEPIDENATLQMTVDKDGNDIHPAWLPASPEATPAERVPIPNRPPAGGLIISVDADTFIVAGFGFSVKFSPLEGDDRHTDFVELWEGDYNRGEWSSLRRLNGDEYALRLEDEPCVRRAKPFLY